MVKWCYLVAFQYPFRKHLVPSTGSRALSLLPPTGRPAGVHRNRTALPQWHRLSAQEAKQGNYRFQESFALQQFPAPASHTLTSPLPDPVDFVTSPSVFAAPTPSVLTAEARRGTRSRDQLSQQHSTPPATSPADQASPRSCGGGSGQVTSSTAPSLQLQDFGMR